MSERLPLSSIKLELPPISKKVFNSITPEKYTDNLPGITYTIDDAVNKAGYGKFQVRLTFLAGLGWLADAFEIIILSIIGNFIACDWPLYRWQNAVLTSVVFAGMMFGSPCFGTIADIYGRRKSLAASTVLLFLFGALSAASPTYAWMVAFRCCMGFALGGVAQGLTLCCEYFPTNVRGKAGFYLCYFWSLGTTGVILLAWLIMDYLNNWRILLAVTSIPALFGVISLKWYPESARYFLVSNKPDQAKKILEQMASMNGTQLPYGHLKEVTKSVKRGRFWDLLGKEYLKQTLLFWYIWLAVAFSYYGIALVSPRLIEYGSLRTTETHGNISSDVFNDFESLVPCADFTRKNYIDLLWTSAAEFPGLLLLTFVVEHCNRKVLLSVCCASSSVLVFALLLETEHTIIVLLILFAARGVLLSIFQLTYVMTSEAFPTTLRAIAMGTGSSFCRLGGLLIPYVAQVLVMENPVAAICLLGGSILLAAIASIFLPLETRGAYMTESHQTNG